MKETLKVAVCSSISLTNFSGATKFLFDAAKLMARHGHDVKVYASPRWPSRSISVSKVQALLSPVPYVEARNIRTDADVAYVNYVPFVWREIKIRGARIAGLHTHLLLPRQHMRETLTHPFKAGYDWYVKAFTFAFLMPFTKCDLMSFDAIHVPGGNFTMPSRSRVYRIPLWIDVDRIPRDVPTKFDKFTVLFSGRKAWEKGWFMFREVASKLRQKGYDFEFLCTGEGEGGIRGLGFLSEDELFCVYQRSHVVVYPSIGDVFGLVILEAATCGVPVVTTPIEAHTGQHLPVLYARSLDDFVKAVLRTYSIWTEQPDRYRAWCRNLRTSAEKYDVKKIFPLFEKMLEDTVNRRKT